MSNKPPTKEQVLKAIEQLENNPVDMIGILTDIGSFGIGAVGAGAAVAAFGGTTLLFGLITVAPPVAMLVGGAALGGAAILGVKKMLLNGSYIQGVRAETLRQLKDNLTTIKAKERQSSSKEHDKKDFILFLKEPVKAELISPVDAEGLMKAVASGQMPIEEAYQLVENIISSTKA